MSETSTTPTQAPDFVQTHWKSLVAGLCIASAVAVLLVLPSMHYVLIFTLATAGTSWNIYAYAQGKRFHVAPGMYAEADSSQKHRRVMLGVCIGMHLVIIALLLSQVFRQAS